MPKNLAVWFFLSIIIYLALVIFHMLGHLLSSKLLKAKLEESSYGIGPKLFRFLNTKLLFRIPIVYCEEHVFETSTEDTHENANTTLISISLFFRQALVLVSGPLVSFVIAVCAFAYIGNMGTSTLLPIIGEIRSGSPAEKAGLKQGDRVISVDNISMNSWDELASIIGNSTTRPLKLKIRRKDELFRVFVDPETKVTQNIFGEPESRPVIGVSCAGKVEKSMPSIWQLPKIGYVDASRLFKEKIKDLFSIFSGSHEKQEIGGPTRIFELTMADQPFIVLILYSIASSTTTIALFSLLPVPIFDGGQFVYLLIERARGKQISFSIKKKLRLISLLLIMSLFAYVTLLDIMYLF